MRAIILGLGALFFGSVFPAQVAALPPLSAYGDLPSVEDMAISPNGKGLAVVAKVKGKRSLIVTESGEVRAAASVEALKVRGVHWVGNNIVWIESSQTEKLGFGFTTKKHEFSSGILFYPDTGKTAVIFEKQRKLVDAIFGYYGTRLVKGRWKSYFGGVQLAASGKAGDHVFDHGRPGLYEVEMRKNVPNRIAHPPGERKWRDWLVDVEGEVGATLTIDTSDGEWTIKNKQRDTIAAGTSPTGEVGLVSFGQSRASLIYATMEDGDTKERWFEVPLAGGPAREILQNVGIESIYVDKRDGTLQGYLRKTGANPKPTFFNPAHQTILDKLYRAFAKHDLTVVDWTPTFTHFIVIRRGNEDSGTYYLVDMVNLKADPVGYERPLIQPNDVGPISTVRYRASDGMEMDGILTLPPGRAPQNLPTIMLPHGGPHAADIATFDWWAQAFASRGYAVFQPNFRGSTNRGDALIRAGYGQWGRKMQTDMSDGLAELVRRGISDPRRTCIMGASYGGYAALAGVTLQQGFYRCAVAVAPVSDLDHHFEYWKRAENHKRVVIQSMKERLGDPAGFDAVSPRLHAAQASAPIMLIHGKDDTVVEFKHSQRMADALVRARKPYELVVLDGEDHWLSKPETRQQMLEAAMRFVQRWNPPY